MIPSHPGATMTNRDIHRKKRASKAQWRTNSIASSVTTRMGAKREPLSIADRRLRVMMGY